MSAENENGKTALTEKNENDLKKDDGVENDKKAATPKPDKADDTKLKDEENKDSKTEDKKENSKGSQADEKDGKDDKDKKDMKEDKKDKSKNKSDVEESDKEDDIDEEEDEDEEDGEDEEDIKKGKKASPKNKVAQKNSKDKHEDDEDDEEDDEGGVELGEIPRIDASISRFKNDDLKLLHKLLFKSPIKTPLLKKNIRKFSGFSFKKSSEEYQKKLASMSQFEVKQLRVICEMLDLEKKGTRDEVSERILHFLVEPKDSGKPSGGGRPRRSAAVKANNRGYSDEDYSSDEKSPRAKRNAGKRSNLKDETSTEESDEDFQPSESEEEKPRAKRARAGRRKKDDSDEEEESEEDSDSDYSDEEPRAKRGKVANNKTKGRGGATRGRRGRPAANAAVAAAAAAKRKAPARQGRKKQETSEEEEESEAHEEASSSEDEPLAKKSAKNPQPPTDDEIKTYVKEILDGANLEEITMKTVCKQVYAHYPDFDLTHKKDYIKNTVKSLIST